MVGLQNFRTYRQRYVELDPDLTVVVGPNAIGKTSIIEALYLLATGSSFRAGKVEEMVHFDEELARVKGKLLDDDDEQILEVVLTRGVVQGKRTQRTHFRINQANKRKKDFVGQLTAVVFRPEDMRLVEGSPSRRRQFLDDTIGQYDYQYQLAVSTYSKALIRKNKLLMQIRDGSVPEATLAYWDQQLIKHGEYIQEKRRELVQFCRSVAFPLQLGVEYEPSVISEERIKQYQSRAVAAGHSLIGPHKDDITVVFRPAAASSQQPLAAYGSRGQQRLGVLWLKLCALQLLHHQSGQRPLLLLDDIFSELDHTSRSFVMEVITKYQTVITTTDSHIADELTAAGLRPATITLTAESTEQLSITRTTQPSQPTAPDNHLDSA